MPWIPKVLDAWLNALRGNFEVGALEGRISGRQLSFFCLKMNPWELRRDFTFAIIFWSQIKQRRSRRAPSHNTQFLLTPVCSNKRVSSTINIYNHLAQRRGVNAGLHFEPRFNIMKEKKERNTTSVWCTHVATNIQTWEFISATSWQVNAILCQET